MLSLLLLLCTAQDVLYLEVCVFNEICANGADLFNLEVGQPFRCDLHDAKFEELALMLQEPAGPEPSDAAHCTDTGTKVCT